MKIFELEKYKENIAFIDEQGTVVYYKDILSCAQKIVSIIGTNKHIYMKASVNIGMMIYYIAFLYTENMVQVVDKELHYDQHMDYIKKYQPEYICEELVDGAAYLDQIYGYGIRLENQRNGKMINKELALLLPTSGSTGDCKFVRQSRKNILSNAEAIIEYLHISENDRAIVSLPLSYTYGLSVLHTHIMAGAALLVPYSKIYQSTFWDFFQTYHGTSFSGVPYTFELLEKLNFFNQDIAVDYITQAGGKLSLKLQDKIFDYARKNKIRFYIMYGQTEATARMSYLPPECFMKRQKAGSVGIPIPGGTIEIHNADTGEKVPPYTNGEIVYLGNNVCLGYANDYQDLQHGDDNQGKLKTGDIGYLDSDGFLYITGRKKRFVKILGKRINLDDMESKINHEFEISCAVVGNDKEVCIYIDIDQTEKILNYSLKLFDIHAQNIQVKYIEEIPRLQSGKSNYTELLKRRGGLQDEYNNEE